MPSTMLEIAQWQNRRAAHDPRVLVVYHDLPASGNRGWRGFLAGVGSSNSVEFFLLRHTEELSTGAEEVCTFIPLSIGNS